MRPDAAVRHTSRTGQRLGWVHHHPLLAEGEHVPTWALAWYAGPDAAVEAAKACAVGCTEDCTRARAAGHRGYVAQATT